MDMIKVIALVCAVVGFLSVTGCVSIHNENQDAPAKEEAAVIPAPVMQVAPGPTAPSAQPKSTVQMVVLEQVPASDTASGQVDILKDAKKPCSSVADDADKFKK